MKNLDLAIMSLLEKTLAVISPTKSIGAFSFGLESFAF